MVTPLRFGSDAIVESGSACQINDPNEVGLAVDRATRTLLTCSLDGTWSSPSSWRAPVATHADLLALPEADKRPDDVRMVTALNRAFTYDGREWKALAVDHNGDFDVPNTSSARKLLARAEVRSNDSIVALGDITTERDLNVGRDAFVKRDLIADGVQAIGWMETSSVTVTDQYVAGEKCNYEVINQNDGRTVIAYPYGTVVTDANMWPMICGLDNLFKYANGQP